MAEIPESYWRLASAQFAMRKAGYAAYQTGELGRTKTIISVSNDEALVIEWALKDYIEKHRGCDNGGENESNLGA